MPRKISNMLKLLYEFFKQHIFKQHVFYILYMELFHNDEHYIVSEKGWLVLCKATPKELRTIIENTKNDHNYVVDEKFIEELRNRI